MQNLKMAFRSVFRNKRRSLLNISALTLGMVVMFLGLGWVNGYHTYIYQSLMDFDTGSAQILEQRYQDEARRFPLDITVQNYSDFREELMSIPAIRAVTGRINFPGTIHFNEKAAAIGVIAVDPAHEADVTVLERQVAAGEYLSESGGVLIGKALAEKLAAKPGDTIYLTAVDAAGVTNFFDYTITGLFSYGYPLMDERQIFISLESAWDLLGLKNEVSRMVIALEKEINPIKWAEKNQNTWEAKGLTVYNWKTFAQTAVSAVEADSGGFYIMLVILYLLTTIGMLNSMSMSLHERTREFGTLRAIGMKKRKLLTIIILEGLSLAAISTIAAIIISIPLVILLQGVGFSFSEIMDAGLPIPFGERFRADFKAWQGILTILTAMGSAAIGSLIPAIRILHPSVAEALGGEGSR